jgi:hypothetical protein
MRKRVLCVAAFAAVLLGTGSGCRLFCDRYCDHRDRDCYDHSRCPDPCSNPPPVRYDHGDNCR